MTINLIVAHGKNREIGYKNQLLWHLPSDLKRFKNITTPHIVVMGRKTFESIGKQLPNRINIVLTRHPHLLPQNTPHYTSIEPILRLSKGREIYIIGGAEVYKAFLPYADGLYITLVDGVFKADTYFPDYNHLLADFQLAHPTLHEQKDEENPFNTSFMIYRKNFSK